MTLLNPWFLLGLVLTFGGTNAFSYWKGATNEQLKAKAREHEAITQAIEQSNAVARKEHERAIVAERQRFAARIAAAGRAVKIEERIRTELVYRDRACRADDDTVRLLNDAIAGVADAGAPAAGRGDGGVPHPGATGNGRTGEPGAQDS